MQDSRWNITEMVPRSVERDFLTYYVQVERVFKGENAVILNSAGITEIKTPQSASLCGNVELEKGRAYLLSGRDLWGLNICKREEATSDNGTIALAIYCFFLGGGYLTPEEPPIASPTFLAMSLNLAKFYLWYP